MLIAKLREELIDEEDRRVVNYLVGKTNELILAASGEEGKWSTFKKRDGNTSDATNRFNEILVKDPYRALMAVIFNYDLKSEGVRDMRAEDYIEQTKYLLAIVWDNSEIESN